LTGPDRFKLNQWQDLAGQVELEAERATPSPKPSGLPGEVIFEFAVDLGVKLPTVIYYNPQYYDYANESRWSIHVRFSQPSSFSFHRYGYRLNRVASNVTMELLVVREWPADSHSDSGASSQAHVDIDDGVEVTNAATTDGDTDRGAASASPPDDPNSKPATSSELLCEVVIVRQDEDTDTEQADADNSMVDAIEDAEATK